MANHLSPKIVRIQTTSLHNFNNATHALFHSNQYDLVAKVEQTKLNIPADALASWKADIDLEVEINKQSMMSALTRELNEKDRVRDNLLTQLFGLMKVHRLSFVETERKPAERLYAALKPYFGIQREMVGDETIHIVGLLNDTDRFTAEVTALGLAPLLAQLKTVNEEYRKLDAQRRSDLVAAKLPDARSVRQQTDADFEVICHYVQAAYLLATKKEDKALILTLVNEMNRVASDLKASYKASAAQKKPKGKKKPGGDKKPSDGDKKPGDDKDKKPSEGDKKPGDGGKKPDGGGKKPGDDGKKPDDGGGKNPGDGGGAGPIPSDPLPMVPKD